VSTTPQRHGIDQLALNMGFGGIKPSVVHPSSSSSISTTPSSRSLKNSSNPLSQPKITPTNSQVKFELNDDISINRGISNDTENDVTEHVVTKIDVDDMTAKPSIVTVPKDPARRAAVLLAGPKFQFNSNEIQKEKFQINTDIIYIVGVSLLIISISNKLKFDLDCCRNRFFINRNMETNIIVFFWFNGWNSLCCCIILYVGSNIY